MKIHYTRYLFLALVVLLAFPAFSQEQPTLRDRADQLYGRYEYANAIPLYIELADSRRPRFSDLERLAHSYLQIRDYESSENWYARVVAHDDSGPEHLIAYGEVLKSSGKYAEARKQLVRYAEATGDHERVALQIAGCDSAVVWMANPTAHRLRNEQSINTARSEFSPFPSREGIYYAGEPDELMAGVHGWTGRAFLRVYRAERIADGSLGTSVMETGELNDERYHAGPLAATASGDTLYVTRTNPDRVPAHERERGKRYRTQRLELHVYTRSGDRWTSEPFVHNRPESYSVGHAAISALGDTLYFASDMPGGLGGTDIWYAVRQGDGSWGMPVNAGTTINTAGDEMFPNIDVAGTLYYSSDGLAGMGGLDIFRATGSGSSWSVPTNLGYPVNSSGDDFGYVVDGEDERHLWGYLSSNRRGGVGDDDIYSFSEMKPSIVIILVGTTSDKSTGERLPSSSVSLYSGGRELIARKLSDGSGHFMFELSPGQQYTVLGQKEGYHADSAKVSTEGITRSDTLNVALLLEPVFTKGQTFELENIYYDFDKHNIRPDAAAILDELVRTMRDNPTLKIELSSHTDSRGSHAYNEALSQRRAQAAVDYLVSRGIARDRMVAQGYGERQLTNRCADGVPCSRDEHQANRRTMVTVLDY